MSDLVDIVMPALGPSMQTGRLVRWLVSAGDHVAAGDVIGEVESASATMEVEADDDGIIVSLLFTAGADGIQVNAPIARMRLEHGAGVAAAGGADGEPAPGRAAMMEAAPCKSGSGDDAATDLAGGTPQLGGTSAARYITQTMMEALRDAIAEEMRRDPDVFLIGEAVAQDAGSCTVSEGLLDEFGPRRVVDMPEGLQALTGMSIGAAYAGLKPVVDVGNWSLGLQALDHVINSAAKVHLMSGGTLAVPIVFRGTNGAAGRLGAQHSQCLSAWLAHVPGLKVVAPSSPADAKALMVAAIRDPGPVAVLETEELYFQSGSVPCGSEAPSLIGKARVVVEGGDVTIVSYARGVHTALEAASLLDRDGIGTEVIDLRTLRPLDFDCIIASLCKTGRLVVVEDAWPVCSIGSEICARAAIDGFDLLVAPPQKVSAVDAPMPYAENLERMALPDGERVAAIARRLCSDAS
ncbi:MAG: pyruvate dehydrogenase complex E1 component subunit beta [Hyphomicrobiaceae bacterium]|nr:pyruvate dehydrogenase complex E1 component subunit beta [Hyphomicrobiaceae bacterium]